MKRLAFATVSLIMVAFSCSKVEPWIAVSPLETSSVIEASTLPAPENENPYFVDMADVDKYVDFRILESLSKGKTLELKSVEPICSDSGEISMYVIRYDEGWDVISSDKRSPMVLASSESGEFEYSEVGPHRFYFDMVSEDLQNFIAYEDKQLILTKSLSEESNENVEYWDAITASEDFIEPYLLPRDTLEIIPSGHWELVGVESERETYDDVDHLIPFEWGQNDPYNAYSPYSTNPIFPIRVLAGCVAVAGAQMLTYLQDLFDMEIEVPSTVYATGNTYSYNVQFNDYGTSLWDDIYTNTTSAAKLISYVGDLVGVQFYNNATVADPLDLKPRVFEYLGINCNVGDFDMEVIEENLLSQLPVIISASHDPDKSGHTFIIDGFKSYHNKYTYTYEWVYGPSSVPLPSKPPKEEIEYSSPAIEQIKMNWGERSDSHGYNNGWYVPTGGWTYFIDEDETKTYDYNKEIIYGFSKSE